MNSNIRNVHANVQEFLFLLQCLYQGRYIDAAQKKDIATLIKECLDEDEHRPKLERAFRELSYRTDIPINFRDQCHQASLTLK